MGKISIVGVLRLRAKSAVSRDRSVRRYAQDDDFVGVLKNKHPKQVSAHGMKSWATVSRPCGTCMRAGHHPAGRPPAGRQRRCETLRKGAHAASSSAALDEESFSRRIPPRGPYRRLCARPVGKRRGRRQRQGHRRQSAWLRRSRWNLPGATG
jgi:hypothetical protein